VAVLPLRVAPDPVLRQKAKRVRAIDPKIEKLIDDMIETMPVVHGVGLAAPQVGASVRVVVVDIPDQGPVALINPEIVKRSGEREVSEACLSVPGYRGWIKRSNSVTVKARDRHWKEIRLKATGLLAQCLGTSTTWRARTSWSVLKQKKSKVCDETAFDPGRGLHTG